MVVIGCYGAALVGPILLFVNCVLIMFFFQCIATEYVVRFCTVVCLYNILDFRNTYFQLPLF